MIQFGSKSDVPSILMTRHLPPCHKHSGDPASIAASRRSDDPAIAVSPAFQDAVCVCVCVCVDLRACVCVSHYKL